MELNGDKNDSISDAPLPRLVTDRDFMTPLLIVLVFLAVLSAIIARIFLLPDNVTLGQLLHSSIKFFSG
ncbi:hypothetical protein [Mastigocladopsis repens]|uniref:hypothetical protein n=1 Tax=Mastigocladopsis repens TaxID=221287 RepID=UPI0012EA334A|nr:hypothetical protein [Mastigocladopsis repens]